MGDENKKHLVLIGAKVKRPVRELIVNVAKEENRTVSHIVAHLLESHPEIAPRLPKIDVAQRSAA